mmetsp:Transcript_11615/g.13500  ORF Transcript_11615/g.13500 Transcript_11615/m.13500 type:complete len:101 (+) Transcript_11615:1239-1541(+)
MDIQHLNQLLLTQEEEAAQALNAVAMSARRRTNILLHEKDVQNELEKEALMNEAVDAVQYILSEAFYSVSVFYYYYCCCCSCFCFYRYRVWCYFCGREKC